MSNSESTRPGLKTWSVLAGQRKRPSEYEVLTVKLHARTRNPQAPYEQNPDSAMNRWYKTHVVGSPLQHPDWDSFRDPDQLTYRAYITLQDSQEAFVDGVLDDHANNRHDIGLAPDWVYTLSQFYTPARFVLSAGQMISAYLVQTAPASTITNCAAFQEADQYRWISRIAYRTRELANAYPELGFSRAERVHFEKAPHWQGFRRLLELALTAYDWGECFFAYNVVAARAVDEACLRQLGAVARGRGDSLSAMLIDNQLRDSARSRRWTAELVRQCLEHEPNRMVVDQWMSRWAPLASEAVKEFCSGLPEPETASGAAMTACRGYWRGLGLMENE